MPLNSGWNLPPGVFERDLPGYLDGDDEEDKVEKDEYEHADREADDIEERRERLRDEEDD